MPDHLTSVTNTAHTKQHRNKLLVASVIGVVAAVGVYYLSDNGRQTANEEAIASRNGINNEDEDDNDYRFNEGIPPSFLPSLLPPHHNLKTFPSHTTEFLQGGSRAANALKAQKQNKSRLLMRIRRQFDMACAQFIPTLKAKIVEVVDITNAVRQIKEIRAKAYLEDRKELEAVSEKCTVVTFRCS